MEYRGIEYTVLPTIPKGWRWSVKRAKRDSGGVCYVREDAIKRAQRSIEDMLRRQALEVARDDGSQI